MSFFHFWQGFEVVVVPTIFLSSKTMPRVLYTYILNIETQF